MKKLKLLSVFILVLGFQMAVGQDRMPVREYTNPDELVVLSQDVSFNQAMTILEELSIEFKDKIFVNQTEYDGPIGVEIPQMHWEDALNRIAEYNNMYVTEYPKYYEIQSIPMDQQQGQTGDGDEEEEQEVQVNFGSREIKISATFFQGDRNFVRELGIDWSTVRNGEVSVETATAVDVQRELFDVEINWSDIFSTGTWEITSLFRALEESGNGEVLSSPSIKVLDGRTGNIQVGQDFSIKQRDFAGNITDEFFSTGTILNVTPNIYYNEEGAPFIYMTVETERSTAQPDPVSTIVNKQEATTEVLMLSGESTVIAGLYETEVTTTRRGVPILKDLPGWFLGLKYLFGYNSTEHTVQELVVLLKVELIPTLEERLNSDDGYRGRPELLDEQRREFKEEIEQMQSQQSLDESMNSGVEN
ncbi:type II secretion system protein GspD [Rhodohalobacter sulfatireducens]|uniref:Type II and III secretion system protein n=1 Tax=Rhodohalobacter sulfatireducens TaxID=2911366 RepID=A0ABS9KEA7_9BACT|nr:type II and III secretion system protein [Rhodohalobacter sulfatireducens]MCG2589199.1 type II and III secretion system protein [Rhodohalobacter sulfatireducens]